MTTIKKVIFKLETDASGVKKGASEAGQAISGVQKNTGGLIGSLKSLGPAIGAAFAAKQIVDFAKQSVKAFGEFESAAASLSAITGLVGEDLNQLKEAALTLAKETGTSATEIVQAFEKVGSAKPELLGSADALQAVTESAITLSQASGLDLDSSIASLTGTLNQFGLGADDAGKVIDILAASAQAGASPVNELSEAFKVSGTVIASSGVSLEKGAALLETLADKQITGAQAGTNLRNILIALQQDQSNYTDGVFDLNKGLDSLEGKQNDVTALTKQFGKESVVAAQILAQNRDRFDELTIAVSQNGIAAEQAATQTDTYEFKQRKLQASVEALQIQLGEKLAPSLSGVIDFVTALINGQEELGSESKLLNDYYRALSEELSTLGEFFSAIIDYAVEIFGLFGDLGEAIGLVSGETDVFGSIIEVTLAPIRALIEGLNFLTEGVKKVRSLFADEATPAAEEYAGALEEVDEAVETSTKGQKKLTEETTKTTNSLTTLKDQLKTLKDEFAGAEVGSDEFNRLRGEIIRAEAEVKRIEDSLKVDITAPVRGSIAFLQKVVSDLQKEVSENAVPGTEEYTKALAELTKASFDVDRALGKIEPIEFDKADLKKQRDQLFKTFDPDEEGALERGRTYGDRFAEGNRKALEEAAEIERQIREEENEQLIADSVAVLDTLGSNVISVASSVTGFLDQIGENQIRDLEERKERELSIEGKTAEEREAIEKSYDNQIQALQKKAFERNKKLQIATAIINGALAVTQILSGQATGNVIADAIIKGIQVAAVIATTAFQVATISRQQFAKGVIDLEGPGTGTSDSIPARLSRGESVMTAAETKEFKPVLKAIRERKIRADVLNSFVKGNGQPYGFNGPVVNVSTRNDFDDRRMVEYLAKIAAKEGNKQPIVVNNRRGARA